MGTKYSDSGLAHVGTLTGAEKWGVTQSGASKYMTPADLATYIGPGGGGAQLVAMAKRNSGALSISSGATAIVNFDYKIYDPDTLITTGGSWAFTPAADAIYRVVLEAFYVDAGGVSGWSSGDEIRAVFYLDGSEHTDIAAVRFTGTTPNLHYEDLGGSFSIDLAVADGPFNVRVTNSSAASREVRVNSQIAIYQLT